MFKVKRRGSGKEERVVMLGLEGSGKSDVLKILRNGDTPSGLVGFHVENVTYKNITLTVWDIGGKDKVRQLWTHYFQDTSGLVFVFDAGSKCEIEEARQELRWLLEEDKLKKAVLLVLAFSADSMDYREIVNGLGLNAVGPTRTWVLKKVKEGSKEVRDGLDWLSKRIK